MNHYILINNASGFVWGECFADNLEMACRLVDEGIGELGREYVEVSDLAFNETGYFVYEAAADRKFVQDGQCQDEIEAVQALPRVAIVKVTDGEGF